MYKISKNNFSKLYDSYPSNTIYFTKVFRAFSYSLSELKSKSKYFKKGILKWANFNSVLYNRANCSQFDNLNKYITK